MTRIISEYLQQIENALKRSDATEHTHRPALKTLIESCQSGITATNEPRRVECGAPDFIITKGRIPLGYIEAKDIGKPLGKIEKSEQFKRYLDGLGNIILTDYLEFRWYVEGEHRLTARLAEVGTGNKLKQNNDGILLFQQILGQFLAIRKPNIKNPVELAGRMAGLAQLIRSSTELSLKQRGEGGKLEEIMEGFRKVLLHDLTSDKFADMYAQTVSYGLFTARCYWDGKGDFKRENAAYDLPKTNPFLRKIFTELAGPDLDERVTWAVDDLAELLNRADIAAILEDFGKRTKQEDPVLHFYETFLAAYDPRMREARGVYYTPEPVVSYIVRSVDQILKTDFGLPDGLADRSKITVKKKIYDVEKSGVTHDVDEEIFKVLILDPAVGTGTFLHSVIDQIYWHLVEQGQKGAWSQYVSKYLLPRLFGFEILMAPYTVAHMKLGIQLKELGYDFKSDERLGIYLTNTLEEAYEVGGMLFARELVAEANAAVKVKLDMPILVVLGNPPYSGHSENKGKWIEELLKGKDILTNEKTHNYFEVDGRPLGERNPKYLHDDYVKFIRFAQWKIERTGYGVLAFISNHGYIDNPTFRGMRQSLIETFDDIYILNLHGNTRKRELSPDGLKDENVFDIQQGVAIGIFVKRKNSQNKPASVKYADLWGTQKSKYRWLDKSDIFCTKWQKPKLKSPHHLFIPQDGRLKKEYILGWDITEILPANSTGIKSHRDDFVFDFDLGNLRERVSKFIDLKISSEYYRQEYSLSDTRDWKLDENRKALSQDKNWYKHFARCLYRPFDIRPIFYSENVIELPRLDIMHHMLAGENIGLSTTRSIEIGRGWEHIFCSSTIIQHHAVSLKEVNYLFPLYLYPEFDLFNNHRTGLTNGRKPNLADKFTKDISSHLKLSFITDGKGDLKKTFGPEDIFDYMYAVFHSPTYRSRYAEFLKIDFPRLPLTANTTLFRQLCSAGSELVGLHLMEKQGPSITSYPVDGDHIVEKVSYTEPGQGSEKGRVWINKTQYFEGVPPEVWEFHIGGYQVCHKWLKDRKERKLEFDDINHYQGIVSAIHETIRLMSEIDEIINKNGGWPIK
ncbi:MAG: DNA methyltransferase [bacterium]|nr:DNA methyltransferase [bacterium]